MIAIVVAMASNNAIGKDNQLLWHITEDLKFFKALTQGGTVIMGRKTYESIGRPLPNRRNIVVSRSISQLDDRVELYHSLEDAVKAASSDERVFIIGGGEIYRQSLPMADTLYITHVDYPYEGDTFFPEVNYDEWSVAERVDHERGAAFEHPFSFVTYKKIG
ncbi:dihydrofolate reductase [Acetobacteroides hydrogenigenes]|uniref:Dihydrofolate reductase n=1 Tax=Acetobacteroides hydrogenigenes TaxID=979970 RepID=A0A4V2RQX3_9BACT|nr:dihydrofolate reductase [Acetobacteroides hydrogenigenes]TCN73181.1 dihydrofolate reductase [Acetobacteroides hydrogenigenes]